MSKVCEDCCRFIQTFAERKSIALDLEYKASEMPDIVNNGTLFNSSISNVMMFILGYAASPSKIKLIMKASYNKETAMATCDFQIFNSSLTKEKLKLALEQDPGPKDNTEVFPSGALAFCKRELPNLGGDISIGEAESNGARITLTLKNFL